MNKKVDEKVKEKLLETIQKKIPNNKLFKLWFSNIEFYEDEEGNIYIPIKTSFKEYFENNFKNIIKDSVREVKGDNCNVYILCQSTINWNTQLNKKTQSSSSYAITFSLNKNYTFDNFVVGNNNKLAYIMLKKVCDNLQEALSPTFIYGDIGIGKTHLLHATIHKIMVSKPSLSCLYISCEGFVNSYVEAMRKNKLDEFRAFVRNIDLLAIDDIHFLSHKEASQEEFFHTFNTLYNSKKQIILSSDCPPKEITGIKDRLISRFMWGQVAPIEPPDYQTKLAIIRHKAERLHLKLSDEIINLLANSITSNIRELEGILNTVKSYSEHTSINEEFIRELLKKFTTQKKRYYSPTEIIDVICAHFNLTKRDLQSEKRCQSLSIARQILIYLLRQYTIMNLNDIGNLLGGRNHATIIYAYNKISKLVISNEKMKTILKNVEKMLKAKVQAPF